MPNILKYSLTAILIATLVILVGRSFFTDSPTRISEIIHEPDVSSSDQDYITDLGLMRGHLIAAEELLDGGSSDEAQYHLDHPIEELYGDIELMLQEKDIDHENFHRSLESLYELAKTDPYGQGVEDKPWESVNNIQSSIDSFFQENPQTPEFIQGVFSNILQTALEEYKAGIGKNCKIVAPIEYQDSFGFVKYVEEELERASWVPNEMKEKMRPAVQELLKAWSPGEPFDEDTSGGEAMDCSTALSSIGDSPSVYPPEYPVMTPNMVSELVVKVLN